MLLGIGVDPGLRHCGLAVVDLLSRRLRRAWLCKSPEQSVDGAVAFLAMARQVALELDEYTHELIRGREDEGVVSVQALVVERQAIRGQAISKDVDGKAQMKMTTRNPQNIVELAHVSGMILATVLPTMVQDRVFIWPQTWNGNKRKEVANTNVWRRLDLGERSSVEDITFEGYDDEGVGVFRGKSNNVVDAVGIAKWYALQPKLTSARVAPPSE